MPSSTNTTPPRDACDGSSTCGKSSTCPTATTRPGRSTDVSTSAATVASISRPIADPPGSRTRNTNTRAIGSSATTSTPAVPRSSRADRSPGTASPRASSIRNGSSFTAGLRPARVIRTTSASSGRRHDARSGRAPLFGRAKAGLRRCLGVRPVHRPRVLLRGRGRRPPGAVRPRRRRPAGEARYHARRPRRDRGDGGWADLHRLEGGARARAREGRRCDALGAGHEDRARRVARPRGDRHAGVCRRPERRSFRAISLLHPEARMAAGDVDGAAIVQFDVKTFRKKVIAFLHPFYRDAYGCAAPRQLQRHAVGRRRHALRDLERQPRRPGVGLRGLDGDPHPRARARSLSRIEDAATCCPRDHARMPLTTCASSTPVSRTSRPRNL